MKKQSIGVNLTKPTFFLITGVLLSNFSLQVGFSLKPYMVISFIFFVFYINRFAIHRLAHFESVLLLFFFFFSLTAIYADYPEYSLRLILGSWLTISCYFVMRFVFSKTSLSSIERALSISGVLFNLSSLVYYFAGLVSINFIFWGNGYSVYGLMMDRNFPRLIGLLSDPNVFAFYNMVFFFYYLTNPKKRLSTIGLLLSSVSMLLTLSRGALIAIAFGLVLMFITARLKQKLKLLFVLPLGLFFVGFLTEKVLGFSLVSLLVARFTSVQSDNGSGRLDLWQQGLDMLNDNPFGIGIFNFQPYNEAIYGKQIFLHNTFLEVLVEGGPFLLVLYLSVYLLIFGHIIRHWRQYSNARYLFYTLFSMLVIMTSLSMIINEALFLIFALIWRYQLEPMRLKNLSATEDLQSAA